MNESRAEAVSPCDCLATQQLAKGPVHSRHSVSIFECVHLKVLFTLATIFFEIYIFILYCKHNNKHERVYRIRSVLIPVGCRNLVA